MLEQVGDTRTLVEVSYVEIFNEEVKHLPRLLLPLLPLLPPSSSHHPPLPLPLLHTPKVRDLLSESLSGVCIDYDQQGAPRLAGLNQVKSRNDFFLSWNCFTREAYF